ncbi:YolD-like family protein [Mammaliicoccus stepanovicii]|uniref:YolD-like protein n=1 Tax=Mammaliicoccus stepanovicii TaxID=643214 RepID=A0A239ZGL3_9STAP|nr:YolD-like family protein [Mammaliicoccus stepanovicii]PNZ79038.1 YolD-like family protein [Mammaliicoccus stepanovicii]GGI41844.1 hypothetical protein GCM10010896_15450 [Mammaliicoccus stepanovicii]SNV70219.1 YolD-like protein [Mammaliicoccus stepanovicii]
MSKMINSNMPDEYKNEPDFRNIPREYLNPRIPKGRGMIKWAPFATMPEQYEIIKNHIEQQNKVDKPTLDDMALSELNNVLAEKLFYNPHAYIIYWDNGYYQSITCTINKLDILKNVLEVKQGQDVVRLSLNTIINIT